MAKDKSGQGKMQLEKMTERQERARICDDEAVDLSIRSWLCSTQVGSSSAVNLRFVCERFRDRVINLILGGIQVSNSIQYNTIILTYNRYKVILEKYVSEQINFTPLL